MKTAKITLNPPEVKSISFQNTFKQQPGQPMKLTIKTQVNVKTNPAAPTTAVAGIKITAEDEEKNMSLEIETLTMAVASTFIDNLDDIIKEKYMPAIMLSVNEKIRSITASFGLTLRLASPQLDYSEGSEAEGPVYYS